MTKQEFLCLLNSVEFPRLYWEMVDKFPLRAVSRPDHRWKDAIAEACSEMGIVPKYDPEDRLFTFEEEQIGDFIWDGAIRKTRKSGIDLFFSGRSRDSHLGSDFPVLAYDAKKFADPTFTRNPSAGLLPYPRIPDNHDSAELKEIVKEAVALVRLIKDAIRKVEGKT
jgi:hypothetical protein